MKIWSYTITDKMLEMDNSTATLSISTIAYLSKIDAEIALFKELTEDELYESIETPFSNWSYVSDDQDWYELHTDDGCFSIVLYQIEVK